MSRKVDSVWNDIFNDYPIIEEINKNGFLKFHRHK